MPEHQYDLKTDEGLRAACVEAEKRVATARIAEVTRFLEEVAATPVDRRTAPAFQDRVWNENPIGEIQSARRVRDPAFGNWFTHRTAVELPMDRRRRDDALWNMLWETVNREGLVARGWRPRRQALRALAALFPADFLGVIPYGKLLQLSWRMGGPHQEEGRDPENSTRNQFLNQRWVRRRLEQTLGEARVMQDHARLLLLSGALAGLVAGRPNAWVIRGGAQGEYEAAALREGLTVLGFDAVDDLTTAGSRGAVKERVRAGYPQASDASVAVQAGQLWRFRGEMDPGDLVLMPRRDGTTVAVGRVAGDYAHQDVDGHARHTRPVVWERTDIPRERFGEASAKAMKTLGTIARVAGKNAAAEIEPALGDPSDEPLVPLPAAERQKSVPHPLHEVLNLLAFVGERRPLEDVLDHIRAERPDLKESAVKARLYRSSRPLDVMHRVGDDIELTDRGRALLASKDPDLLRDHLLTTMFGVDHALVRLAEAPAAWNVLVTFLQDTNAGWTTATAPSALLRVLTSLDLVKRGDGRTLRLTERGERWRRAIHWIPERIEPDVPVPPLPRETVVADVPAPEVIVERVQESCARRGLAFDPGLIESLHLGIWANGDRHFAVLAGLSGSGKTQLAMEYGRALTGADDESDIRLSAVSTAPGWHDPTALLGYVNPLNGEYAGTDFQRFLLHAAEHPGDIHVCVLDEMNLSHPEQYLAPILSAMEREGGMVEFHDEDEEELGVPQRIRYPRNLVLIGTVNMDETTMGISDKVLDRAFTLEFWDIDVDAWPGWDRSELPDHDKRQVRALLAELMEALRPARLHFGWRVIHEFVRFLERRDASGSRLTVEEALDQITYAKVLPKLRGDDAPRFRKALTACEKAVGDAGLERCRRKLRELGEDLDETGSFRFWR